MENVSSVTQNWPKKLVKGVGHVYVVCLNIHYVVWIQLSNRVHNNSLNGECTHVTRRISTIFRKNCGSLIPQNSFCKIAYWEH